ncbi:unnamed protein product [Parnassius apollo]|uniref:(apollo) hypothetical protein n=1 Tax=Parnassius apollo TaxID=110799 RepID=A0A8S3YAV9_PARAO|nr:unnamed protein product [Parnassius apollo]
MVTAVWLHVTCNRELNDSLQFSRINFNLFIHYSGTGNSREDGKRTFMCSSCSNVTQRIRVTDDTPVRDSDVQLRDKDLSNLSFEESTPLNKKGSLTSEGMINFADLLDKVNSVIVEKLSSFETKILSEIKASVTVLAQENSKLRQYLSEANKKCSLLEQQISILKNGKNMEPNVEENRHSRRKATVSKLESDTTPSLSLAPVAAERPAQPALDRSAPSGPELRETSAAASSSSASKAAKPTASDTNTNTWTEVKGNKKYNSVPNCKGRPLDLVLSARSDVRVTGADEALQPVDAYHPPLAMIVGDATARAPLPSSASAPALVSPIP